MKNLLQSLFILIYMTTPQYLTAQSKIQADSFLRLTKSPIDTVRALAYIELATMMLGEDIQLAKRYIDTAQQGTKNLPEGKTIQKLLAVEGNYLSRIAKYQEAYISHLKSQTIAQRYGDKEALAIQLGNIGGVLMNMRRPEEAVKSFEEAIRLLKELDNKKQLVRVLTNLAGAYFQIPSKAALVDPTLAEALKYGLAIKSRNVPNIYVNKLGLEIDNKQFAQAAIDLQELKKVGTMFQDADALAHVDYFNALLDRENGQPQKAIVSLNLALERFKKIGNFIRQFEIYQQLVTTQSIIGDYKGALASQKNFQMMSDSMYKVESIKNINELEAKYQNEKKQTQIEQQATELSQRRWIQSGLLVGLAVLGFLTFLLFQQNKKMSKANDKIKRQATQLEIMMRELHHRTKNNMQVVSSLLSLQTVRLEDHSEAADAMRSGQSRVEAMSLIHQRLYQNADVATVNIQEFTKDLVGKLAFVFGQPPSVLSTKITIQKPEINVDMAMPLGLILNELLTNSFKYAFAKNDNPLLTIDLQEQYGQLRLHYADNGTGLPPQYRIENSDSFGMQLIVSLAQQVDATYKYWNDAGFHFELSIPAT